MADPYEQAFAALGTALVDLDGDGVPDVAVPARDPMREINRRLPERSPMTRAGFRGGELRNAEPEENALLQAATFPARAFVDQAEAAGRSIGEATLDPSLANVTNAGVQNALLFGRPIAAAAMGGAGLLEAARRDFAPSIFGGSSEAQSFLTPEQRDELKSAKTKIQKGQFSSGAERRMLEATVNRLNEMDAKLAGEKAANEERLRAEGASRKQQEDASARARAQGAYDAGLATDRRFSDTEVGKVFDKFGPVAPGVVGFGTGAVTGAGMRGMGVTGKGALYGVPAAVGAASGIVSANWPMAYEAMYAPAVNPSFQAAQNYVREAPSDDPRAAQLRNMMTDGTIKEQNPVRDAATRELYDPIKFAERSVVGGLEGVLGGVAGGELLPAAKYLMQSAPKAAYQAGQVPGRALRGVVDGVVTPTGPRNALLTAADDPAAQAFRELRVGARQEAALPPPGPLTGTGLPPGRGGNSAPPPPAGPQTTPPPAATGAADGLTDAERQDAIVRALLNRPPQGQPPAPPLPPPANVPNQQPLPTSARLQFQNDVAEVLRSNLGADATFVRNLAARPDYYARVIPSMLRNRAATPEEQADALQMIQAIVASAAPRNALLP